MSYPNDPNNPGPQYPGQYPGEQPDASQNYPGMVPAEPAKPKKKKTPLSVVITLLVVLVAGAGFAIWKTWTTDTSHASVGDCIKVDSVSKDDSKSKQIPCDDKDATYKVTEVFNGPGTCDPNEQVYQAIAKKGNKVERTICLTLNVKPGDCLDPKAANNDIAKVACTDPKAGYKVLKVDETKADPSACETPDQALMNKKRNITYCLTAPTPAK